MRHIVFDQSDSYPIALLIKPSAFNSYAIETHYINPLVTLDIPKGDVIAVDLEYDQVNKVSASTIKNYIATLLPELKQLGVTTLFVADANYFKALTKQTKSEANIGYVFKCVISGFEDMSVVLSINYQQLVFNPTLQDKLDVSIKTLAEQVKGTFVIPGTNIIHSEFYPNSWNEIRNALNALHQYPILFADIEAFSLDFRSAGIGTIAFAWDKHNGIAFSIDYSKVFSKPTHNGKTIYGQKYERTQRKNLLTEFLCNYKGKIVWHNVCYDVKVLIYELFMKNLEDTEGLLNGLSVLTNNFEDTKIISYLATNSTSGNKLGLKDQAQEFAGNWAQDDIKDIRYIHEPDLLQYNLVDALSTAYVYEKNLPIMIADNQEKIYNEIMIPSVRTIIQMELTGMPIKWNKLVELEEFLLNKTETLSQAINDHHIIKTLNFLLQGEALEATNAKLKVKQHTIEKFQDLTFNPNSNKQLQTLLYTQMALPVLDKTDSGAPATGADTIEKLIEHTQNPDYKHILGMIIEHSKAAKIQSTFIPAFKTSTVVHVDVAYLFGSFNIGGTVSGRLSSSNPKQNWALLK